MSDDVDPVLLGEFIDESLDNLRSIPSIFIQLESEPENLNLVNAIFRPVHTLKGSSSFFGVMKVQRLAHVTETVMDLLRQRKISPNHQVIDGVLGAVETIIEMLESIREGGPELPNQELYNRCYQVVEALAKETGGDELDSLTEIQSLLEHAIRMDCDNTSDLRQALKILEPLLEEDSQKSSVENLTGPLKDAWETFQQKLLIPCESCEQADIATIRSCLEQLKELNGNEMAENMIGAWLDTWDSVVPTLGYDPLVRDQLIEGSSKCALTLSPRQTEKKTVLAEQQGEEPSTQTTKPSPEPDAEAPTQNLKTVKTMRVAEEAIDNFFSYVGELIVTRYKFEHLRREFANQQDRDVILDQFRKLNESFTELSEDIEQSIMNIRRVKVKSLTQKVPKIVRDIATATGKKISLSLRGEEIEVDKSLVDTLEGPMVHMVRNAADHGIESTADRLAVGKAETGLVSIVFSDMDESICMSIRDDGKGLDLEKLQGKALEMGLIKAGQTLDEKGIIDLLFMSGVSTAKEVTDVSGRGVGMDVVRQSVNAAGGVISVSSEMGQGCEFKVTLPKSVTTQIIEGFILDVSNEKYVLPLKCIVDASKVERTRLVAEDRDGECTRREDGVQTVYHLSKIFETKQTQSLDFDGYIVTVEDGEERLGVRVDNILGIQQVVVKPIEDRVVHADFFSGAALLGDGSVALVIDVEALFGYGTLDQEGESLVHQQQES